MLACQKSFVGSSWIWEVGSFTNEFREGFLEGVTLTCFLKDEVAKGDMGTETVLVPTEQIHHAQLWWKPWFWSLCVYELWDAIHLNSLKLWIALRWALSIVGLVSPQCCVLRRQHASPLRIANSWQRDDGSADGTVSPTHSCLWQCHCSWVGPARRTH